MQKITPHLWFDKEAKEAVEFYTSVFMNSKITNITTIHEVPTPTGDSDIVSFELSGQPFMAINAGPLFKFNPSISFIVNFDPSRDKNAKKILMCCGGNSLKAARRSCRSISTLSANAMAGYRTNTGFPGN